MARSLFLAINLSENIKVNFFVFYLTLARFYFQIDEVDLV